MKILLTSLIFSFSLFAQETGKTYIEEFMKSYNKEPESFSEFIQDLNTDQFEGLARTNVLSFPVSRSLQKGKTSYKFPRQVVSVNVPVSQQTAVIPNFNNNGQNEPQIFIGYAPEAGSLEVISWNPNKRKYEFFQVEDFGPGQKPKLIKSDEKTCLKCHQSGGPIFTHFPWSESTQTPDSNVASRHQEKLKEAEKNLTAEELKLKQFSSANNFNFSGGIFGFDGEVRTANLRLSVEKMCIELKKNPKKEEILENILIANHPDISDQEKKAIQLKLKVLLKTNYSHPSSVILDHDPTNEVLEDKGAVRVLANKEQFRTAMSFNPSFFGQSDSSAEVSLNQSPSFSESFSLFSLKDTKGLKTLVQSKNGEGSLLNPITKRPEVSSITNSSAALKSAISHCILGRNDFLANLDGIPVNDLKTILRKAQLTTSMDPQGALKLAVRSFYQKKSDCPPEEKVLTPTVVELSDDSQKIALELVKSGLDLNKKIDDEKAFENIKKSCSGCHDPQSKDYFGIDINYPKNKEDMAKFAKYSLKDSKNSPLMRIFDKSMPADMDLEDKEREEMMIYILKFIK